MTRLILTADSSSAGCVVSAGHADLAVAIELRMVWGPPRSDAELAAYLEARTSPEQGSHWLDWVPPQHREKFGITDLKLIEACERCETVELWMETEPNAQLVLIWLLDYLGPQAKTSGIILRHVDASLGETEPARLAKSKFMGVAIKNYFPVPPNQRAHRYFAALPTRQRQHLVDQVSGLAESFQGHGCPA